MPAITNTHDLLSPELRAEINRLTENERVRIEHHGREVARYSGVSMSGMGPGPIRVKTADELIRMAEANIAKARVFRDSPRGRFMAALSRLDREAHYVVEATDVRSIYSRSIADEREALNVAAVGQALAILNDCAGDAARDARAALCDLLVGEQKAAA